jgi:hypothetical protein
MQLLFGETAGRAAGAESSGSDERMNQLREAVDEGITEVMQLRERVEDFVVPEVRRQGELLAKILADLKDAGISTTADDQSPQDEGRAAER